MKTACENVLSKMFDNVETQVKRTKHHIWRIEEINLLVIITFW